MARQRHDPLKDLVGFLLGDVMYAVRIEVVRQIVNPLTIVDVPHAPPSVKGVADYRGEVVPVVDLRERFGLPSIAPSRKTKWVVLDVSGGAKPRSVARLVTGDPLTFRRGTDVPDRPVRQTGVPPAPSTGAQLTDLPARSPAAPESASQVFYAALVVDAVTEVFGLGGGELRPAPPLGAGDDKRGIEGVTTFGSRLVFVLDARAFGPVAHAALSWAPGVARDGVQSS